MAAKYLALGEASFRALAVRAGVAPVEMGLAVTRWRRRDLDSLVEKLPARGTVPVADDSPEIDPAQAALERIARRAEGKRP